jgi:uncharacterized protein YndB with AHSA1/START domain
VSDMGKTFPVLAARFECLLPGPAERVWDHLTNCEKLAGWFGADGTIEPREGGAVRLMGGHIRGVVTQWKPARKLTYTWNVFRPGQDEAGYPESYVSFELEPRDGAVLLTLTHLPVLERFEKQNAMGWRSFLDMLAAAVRGQTLEPRANYFERNAQLYGVDLNKLAT